MFESNSRCLRASVVNCCSDVTPEINQRKQGEAGEFGTSPCPAFCSALNLSSSRISGPAVPAAHAGPRSDKMRFFMRCVSCSRRRCGSRGSRGHSGGAITALRNWRLSRAASFTVAAHGPLPAVHEVCPLPRQDASDRRNTPGGGTFVREDRSSQKRVAAAPVSVAAEFLMTQRAIKSW